MTIDTTFLVGTGAEKNAWDPVSDAIRAIFPASKNASNRGWQNFIMAKLVAICRAHHGAGKQCASTTVKELADLKKKICENLDTALKSKEISLRGHFVRTSHDSKWGEKAFLTTNWDFLLANEFGAEAVVAVHGRTDGAANLYLPSEYAFDPMHCFAVKNSMFQAQDKCIQGLWAARTIVIYGLSLDPLDGELAAICQTGFNRLSDQTPLEKIMIYDLPCQESVVVERVNLLLPNGSTTKVTFQSVI